MRCYSHLSEDERDQIAVLHAGPADPLARLLVISGAPKPRFRGNFSGMRCLPADVGHRNTASALLRPLLRV
jgi:hypothetical protein